MSTDSVLRLRCPADVADPSSPHEHYAVDVRLPLACIALETIAVGLDKCLCGRDMVVITGGEDPWVRG